MSSNISLSSILNNFEINFITLEIFTLYTLSLYIFISLSVISSIFIWLLLKEKTSPPNFLTIFEYSPSTSKIYSCLPAICSLIINNFAKNDLPAPLLPSIHIFEFK